MEKIKNIDETFVLIRMHKEYWKLLEDMKKGVYNGGNICLCGNLIKQNNGRICEYCRDDRH